MTHTLTTEETAVRARIAEIRAELKDLAAKRKLILGVYRMPHGTPEHKQAMVNVRQALGIPEDYMVKWAPHAIPNRFLWRAETHQKHLQLAELTGKPHVREPLPA
jgi:hypothetical protein